MATVKGVWVFNDTISLNPTFSQFVEWGDPYGYTFLPGMYGLRVYKNTLMSMTIEGTNGEELYSTTNGWSATQFPQKTVDFGSVEQEVSDEFYEWLTANAIQTQIDVKRCKLTLFRPKDISTLLFITAYRYTGETTGISLIWHFTDDGSKYYTELILYDYATFVVRAYNNNNASTVYNITVNGQKVDYDADLTSALNNPHGFSSDTTIEMLNTVYSTDGTGRYCFVIGETPEEEPPEETPKTLITYNGSTIATLEAGETATLACKGKTMKSNIVVRCPPYVSYGGSISYNGKITDVSGNRSATLLCKDKRMKDDVVIKANEEPFVEIQFSIANTTYYAEQGMTWGEWVDSEYNTTGYFIDNGGGVAVGTGPSWVHYYDKETNYAYGQDSASIIVAGRAYYLIHSGGSN